MNRLVLVAVVVAILTSVAAYAQFPVNIDPGAISARQLSMGAAGIAIADDATAWAENPAGLASLNLPASDKSFPSVLDAQYSKWQDSNAVYNLNWSGYSPTAHTGFGAGLSSTDGHNSWECYGAGIGTAIKGGPVSVGLQVKRLASGDKTAFGAGALYRGKRFNIGARLDNLNNTDGLVYGSRILNPGVAVRLGNRLIVAVDALDATNVSDDGPYYCFGGEFKLTPALSLRAGHNGIDSYEGTSFGLGYAAKGWHCDFGYLDRDDSDAVWALGAGINL